MTRPKIDRRRFIERSSIGFLGAGLAGNFIAPAGRADQQTTNQPGNPGHSPAVKSYRRLGRTGFRVSDLSSGAPSNENVLRHLLDSGVNFIDAGETYGNGAAEELIGKVIRDYDRSKLFINSKLYPQEETFPSKKEVIKRTEAALERLGTDYVDCMMIHSAEDSKIIKDQAFHDGMKTMKRQGKVRAVGVSCHGNNWAYDPKENLEQVLMTAVNDGRFDVILLAYNFVNAEMAGRVLQACRAADIGTVVMKSNPVYIYHMIDDGIRRRKEEGSEISEYMQNFYDKYKKMHAGAAEFFKRYGAATEEELSDAALKFILGDERAHTIIWDFKNFDSVTRILGLSGQKLDPTGEKALSAYRQSFGPLTCHIGCNECEKACPHHLPVNTIMRYNYYFMAKKEEKESMKKFAGLPGKKPSEVCTDCDAPCEQACPNGVQTRSLLAAAQHNLDWVTATTT